MKVIFSRKGFDSQYGKVPSAILPDGKLVSFPIEDRKSIISASEIRRAGESVGAMVETLTSGRFRRGYPAHLDPDLDAACYPRKAGWRPVLGQAGGSLGHLSAQGVGTGALFLFFGWYRPVDVVRGVWAYRPGISPVHLLWGWLHVGACFAHTEVPPDAASWLAYHPHLQRSNRIRHALFTASDWFRIGNRRVPGGGYFPAHSPQRVLSAQDENMSVWSVPDWMHPSARRARFSYIHAEDRWSSAGPGRARVQTVGKGQEIVMSEADPVALERWLAGIFDDVPST